MCINQGVSTTDGENWIASAATIFRTHGRLPYPPTAKGLGAKQVVEVAFRSAWQPSSSGIRSREMGRVLLLEDHKELQGLLAKIIGELGHKADCVNSSREAQLRLATDSYDLLIADICLPADSGYRVAELAEALGTKTVLMSGHPDEVHQVHLAKPFSLVDFVRLIAEHLGDPPAEEE